MGDLVLVVGAGPVGLTMAMALKRLGVETRIIDEAAMPSDKSKALVLWPRTLELLDVQGCVQRFLDAGMQATGARIVADGKTLVQLSLDTAPSPYRFALMLPQSDTERLLNEELRRLGLEVERRVSLKSFFDDGHGVSAQLLHADGREESVRTSFLVGCDGAHSTVRHILTSRFDGSALPSDWILADVHLEGDLPPQEITICWTSEGVLVFFPIGQSRFRVIADGGPAMDNAPTPTLDDVQRMIDTRGPAGLRAHDPIWLSHFRINERKVSDYRKGRVFLAGDAAHIHSPAGGQGMNTGMQDAFNLSWKIALTWRNLASSSLLDSYSPERSAVGDAVLRDAGNMTKIAILRNPILQEIRSFAVGALGHLAPLRQRLVNQLTELDLNYRDSELSRTPHGAARHPASGDRAPDMMLATAGGPSRLYELLSAGKFVLVLVGIGKVSIPVSLQSIAVAAQADSAAGYDPQYVYLVRPDAYLMMSARPEDISPITIALERIRTG
jgi:2-polyprenyl-6-methoxyphenol hydroxylase-like FAD-dependent oxidoreductase